MVSIQLTKDDPVIGQRYLGEGPCSLNGVGCTCGRARGFGSVKSTDCRQGGMIRPGLDMTFLGIQAGQINCDPEGDYERGQHDRGKDAEPTAFVGRPFSKDRCWIRPNHSSISADPAKLEMENPANAPRRCGKVPDMS